MRSKSCPSCALSVSPEAKFCSHCAFQIEPDPGNGVVRSQWRPHEQLFAARIEPSQLRAWFSSGIHVDESQTGLLFFNGKFEHELSPGKTVLQTLPQRIARWVTGNQMTAVLIRKGMFQLQMSGEMKTTSGEDLSVHFELAVSIQDRNAFYVNLMQSKETVTSVDLLNRVGPSARQTIFSLASTCDQNELLSPPPELQQKILDQAANVIEPAFARWGIGVDYVSPITFTSESISQYQAKRAKVNHELREAKLWQDYQHEKDKLEAESYRQRRLLKDAKSQQEIEDSERESEQRQTLRDVEARDEQHRMNVDESLEASRHEIKQLQHERDDQNSLRRHELAKIEVDRRVELTELEFRVRSQALKQDQSIDHDRRQHAIREREIEHDAQLQELEKTASAKILRWQAKRKAIREDSLEDAKARVEVETIRKDSDRGHRAKDHDESERQKGNEQARKLDTLKELRGVQLDSKDKSLDLKRKRQSIEQEEKESEHRRQEEVKANQARADLDRLNAMQGLPEIVQLGEMARQAADNPAMAPFFGQAMKMAMAKGMTPEQLEMLAAEQSPTVAEALKEKYRAEASAQEKAREIENEGYERLLSEIKSANTMSQDQVKDILDRIERMGINGQQMLRDVGAAPQQGGGNLPPDILQLLLEALRKRGGPW